MFTTSSFPVSTLSVFLIHDLSVFVLYLLSSYLSETPFGSSSVLLLRSLSLFPFSACPSLWMWLALLLQSFSLSILCIPTHTHTTLFPFTWFQMGYSPLSLPGVQRSETQLRSALLSSPPVKQNSTANGGGARL